MVFEAIGLGKEFLELSLVAREIVEPGGAFLDGRRIQHPHAVDSMGKKRLPTGSTNRTNPQDSKREILIFEESAIHESDRWLVPQLALVALKWHRKARQTIH